jgi:hypothetical protein
MKPMTTRLDTPIYGTPLCGDTIARHFVLAIADSDLTYERNAFLLLDVPIKRQPVRKPSAAQIREPDQPVALSKGATFD